MMRFIADNTFAEHNMDRIREKGEVHMTIGFAGERPSISFVFQMLSIPADRKALMAWGLRLSDVSKI